MEKAYVDKFLQKFETLAKGKFELLTEYKGYHELIEVKCLECGKTFSINAGGFSGKCKYCNNGRKIASKESLGKRRTLESFKEEVKAIDEDYRCISKEYKNNKTPIMFKHLECGEKFLLRPNDFLNGRRCPICAMKMRDLNSNKSNYLEELVKDEPDYEWLEPYKGSNKIKHKIRHKVCNNVYLVRPNDFQQGYRCPFCYSWHIPKRSILHKNLEISFYTNNIIASREISFNLCRDKDLLYYDFYILKYQLLIEIDGSQHFKQTKTSVTSLEYNIRHDTIKNNFAKENSIKLLRISYKTKSEDLEKIVREIIDTKGNLSKKFIIENNLYFSNGNIEYNTKEYYTKINKNYFKEKEKLELKII